MTIVSNYFNYLHFTECKFEQPCIEKTTIKPYYNGHHAQHNLGFLSNTSPMVRAKIVIPTHQLGLLPGHPLNKTDELIFWENCNLIFDGVKKSVRQQTEYIEDSPGSNQFKPCEAKKRTVLEDSLSSVDEPVTLFELEGIFNNPLEWVDWEIESVSFYLEVQP